MDKSVKVSIIVPIYNVEKYLNRCIYSITEQTYKNIEIILVDDGSPDKCPEICDTWEQKDARIRVLHKQNGGLSDARNKGIECATGQYIAFVDSDDYIDYGMISRMLEAAISTSAEIATCGRYLVYGETVSTAHTVEKEKIFTSEEAISEILTNGCIEEAAWDKLYNIELFNEIRYPYGEINEDVITTLNLIRRCSRVVHIGAPLYYYCHNSESITRSGYKASNQIYIKHIAEIDNIIARYYPLQKRKTNIIKAKYALNNLFLIAKDKKTIEKYKKDYITFMKILRHSFLKLLFCENFQLNYKLKGILMIMGIYTPIRALIKGEKS